MPSVSRIFFICLPAPNGGVSGNMDYLRYKREPVHHLGWVSAVWVIWCSSSSSTYGPAQPKHQHLATVRNPNPRRLSFQTLRYVQRSNNPPSVWAPPLLFGFDRVGHSCLLGTVAKLFAVQISQGRVEKAAEEWNTSDLTSLFDHFHRATCVEGAGEGHHRPVGVRACAFSLSLCVFTESLN